MPITTNYSCAYVFTKHTNLLQWFNTNLLNQSVDYNKLIQYYSKPRKVQLILLYRFDENKCYCKIKCPINPIPVKGEFETPSLSCIEKFLKNEGWQFEQKLPISLLK